MNKILLWLKNILMFILVGLIIKTYIDFNQYYLIYFTLMVLYVFISLKDLFKKKNINDNILYNVISILVLLISIIIFARVLYDDGFIYNSEYYLNKLVEVTGKSLDVIKSQTKIYQLSYLGQNMFFLVLMLLLLFIYRQLNVIKTKKEHFINTIFLLITSILSLLPIIEIIKKLDKEFSIIYLIGLLILTSMIVVRKKEGKYLEHKYIYYATLSLFIIGIIVSTLSIIIKVMI